MDWSRRHFLQVEIDPNGGGDYTLVSSSEILSVPRALYAERAASSPGSDFGLYVTDFGARGDGNTDDTNAFRRALDSANVTGQQVLVPAGIYRITRPLFLRDGVALIGEGPGSEPLQTPFNGSLLRYEGNGFALRIVGHNVQVKNLVLRDQTNGSAGGGIIVRADARLVEGVQIDNVLVSGFLGGPGLRLTSRNAGGIAYAAFSNLRVRNGRVGFQILEDETSFTNSNTWSSCQISGGGFVYGILVEGGNNNTFNQVVIEPPQSDSGHLVVRAGEITGVEIRIEGVNQAADVPLIQFLPDTRNSVLTGIYAGGLTLDQGNNFINLKSGKAIGYRNATVNQFSNPNFFSPSEGGISDWQFAGDGVTVSVLPPELIADHQVLRVTIPPGGTAEIEPQATAIPAILDLPLYDQVNFGIHAKVDFPDVFVAFTNAPAGIASSQAHSGSGNWEFVGMNALVNRSTVSRFAFQIANTTGAELTVFLTTPTLSFGNQLPNLEAAPLRSSGGQLTGLLTNAFGASTTPSTGFLTLPRNANYYAIAGTNTITRINYLTADRFPRGSVVTLLFDQAGANVTSSAFLNLVAGFTSVANASLTLISNGDGTWREVNRNH
ncbi:MAG: glycosyl hydrolase family 28-related protein [Bacteroidota bacterium]